MSGERALVFVEDPGAAVFVAGLAAEPGMRLYAVPPAAEFLRARGIPMGELAGERAADHVAEILREERPVVLVVGTSENVNNPAFEMIRIARDLGVTTVGVVDALANADARFRGTTTDPLAHAPDWLLVPDEATRRAFVALGYPADRVSACGHPQHDEVALVAEELKRQGRDVVRRRALPPAAGDLRVVLFAAEVSTGLNPSQYRRSDTYTLSGNPESSARTEVVLDELLLAVDGLDERPFLVLRLHPKNEIAEFARYSDRFDHVSTGDSALEIVFASDLVVGMTSMLVMEAALMGVPTLSIVPRASEAEWLPSVAAGWTPRAASREEVQRLLRTQLATKPKPPFSVDGRALNRMTEFLRTVGASARKS